MEILAVVVGYLLGIAPNVVPKIIEMIQNRAKKEIENKASKEETEIFDEWLNGPKNVNQQDIYNEYVTGEETTKGE